MPFGDSRLDWAVCFLIISKLGKLEMNYLLLILVHRKRIGISLSLSSPQLCGAYNTSYGTDSAVVFLSLLLTFPL